MTLTTMKNRSQFQRLTNHGARFVMRGFILQAAARNPFDEAPAIMGYTVSKKVGNAVERNRVKRRLRAIARERCEALAKAGWDYVLVGRRQALYSSYEQLLADFERAMGDVIRKSEKNTPKNADKTP